MDKPNNKTAIQAMQTHQMFAASNISLLTSLLLAAILAFMQHEVIADEVVLSWFALIVLITIARVALVKAYQQPHLRNDAPTQVWLTRFRLGVLAAGMTWGAAGFLLFPADYPQHQMFLIFMLTGLTAGGVISYAADLFSGLTFSVTVIAPLIIRLLITNNNLSIAMAMAALLYIGFMFMSLRYINRNILENINLHLDAAQREEIVKASEERYRLLLNHSPVGIFHYNAQLVITYCNDRFADILRNSTDRLIGLDMHKLKDQSVLPALNTALTGETSYYEGHYRATLNDSECWIAMTCAASRNASGKIIGGIAIVQDITASKLAADEIKNLAFYDALTGLPNRRLLMDRLKQALTSSTRSERAGALLFIDLDNFKTLNDTLGHDIGDMLLQQVSQRLTGCVRENDTVARLGGDEFVVMLEDLNEQTLLAAEQTEAVGEKILAALNQPFLIAEHVCRSTPSLGATLFTDHKLGMEELLKQADIAMYQAKKSGRNTLRFFDPQMQITINSRAALESELRNALVNDEFHLYYQIQVDDLHRPLGAETLIRWIHPERGMVSPAQFIPLAEETGLILPIGLWVLDTACAQLKSWQDKAQFQNLVLSVNVSAKQFLQSDFADLVRSTIQRHAINPCKLKLELTESLLLENTQAIIATMTVLKESGVQFSLDDFGTGYSSLQYLKKLPLDQLKIDQSFVRDIVTDLSDRAIVSTIIAMAQTLSFDVIAEGVETEKQRLLLLEKGCQHFQGYLFGKPVPIDQFESTLAQHYG